MNYTPIASKSFGIDTETGLEKQLQVWGQFNDAKNERIIVYFDIALLSPTGLVVKVIRSSTYTREGIKFIMLRESQLGQGITMLIETDIEMITSYETIDQDLKQVTY